ncbi:hypothetical protein [Amycolatopsis alkalitolerans]|uniref:Uncharacterized protein n=1 Tax=Amycolatopsis alkalitolerans TaxID=2547244 RepID=A0A5C4LUG0_9PSEU|nr:hypothetical protein [Amycolatopsis alkalitolerans]TNC21080.1 hypothetical protein FG385_29275 [Amycolatopsis alkalitolerans]
MKNPSGHETDQSDVECFRAPLRWRVSGIPIAIVIVMSVVLLYIQHQTALLALPLLCAVVVVACIVGISRVRTRKQAALLALVQLVAGLGGLALLLLA